MSTFGLDPDQDEVETFSLRDVAAATENLLIAHVTGEQQPESRYRVLRKRLLTEVGGRAPDLLRTCRNLGQVWAYAKKWPTYAERRQVIWEAFGLGSQCSTIAASLARKRTSTTSWISQAGVFVIDTKHYKGRVQQRDVGGMVQGRPSALRWRP